MQEDVKNSDAGTLAPPGKKLMASVARFADDGLEGWVASHPNLRFIRETRVVYRAGAVVAPAAATRGFAR